MTVCLVLLAILTALTDHTGDAKYGKGSVAVIFVFQAASFGSWMILTYAYPPQILRFAQRANGVALALGVGYGFCVMMSYTLPLALEHLGWRFYAINAAWNVGIVVTIFFLFVEMNDKTLEEVDALFDGRVHFDTSPEKGNIAVIEGVGSSTPPPQDAQKDFGFKLKSEQE